jgi:translocator protein
MPSLTAKTSWWPYVLCAIAVFAAASAGGFFRPGAWYLEIKKPTWNPPAYLFGPVWTVLYIMIAIAGARVFASGVSMTSAQTFWVAQLVLNALWSFLFFGMRRIDLALIDIGLMLATIIGFIVVTWGRDRTAALLFVPYLAWVSFAAVLNATLWMMNP